MPIVASRVLTLIFVGVVTALVAVHNSCADVSVHEIGGHDHLPL